MVLWASAFVGVRSARHEFTAGPLTLGRLCVGAVALSVMVAIRRDPLPRQRRDIVLIVVCGALWFGAYNLALNQSERLVDAGTAAMLVNLGPILIAVLAGVLLGEGFPPSLLRGLAVAFAGVVMIAWATSTGGSNSTLGVVLGLVAAATFAGGVISQKPVLVHVSGLTLTWLACTVGAVLVLPFAPALVDQVQASDASGIAWLLYLGVVPTALGFSLWAYALAHAPAGRTSALTYLVPLLVVLMGWVFLSETPPALGLVGGALCLAGVAITRR